MTFFRHVAMSTTIHASEINALKTNILKVVSVYEAHPMDLVIQKGVKDTLVDQFLELRKKGLSVSMLFFVAPIFMEASLAKNTGREAAVAKLLEDCSWVYSRKALVVLRDVATLPVGTLETNEIDSSYYVSLKSTFHHFLESEGDPSVVSRPMSILENAAALFGAGPSSLQRMTLDRVSPVSVELPSKDSSLFETITTYLDLEIAASTDKDLQSSREALESELEAKTIYSRRLLHIIGGRLDHLGVRLEDFLSSEYTSIRPKIVRAILNSQNMGAWKSLLRVPTLSFDPKEDREFRLDALLKISTKETNLGDFLRTVLASAQGQPFCQLVFQAEVVPASLKISVLETLNSDNLADLLPSIRDEVVVFLAECINSPEAELRQRLSKLHVLLMKEVLTDLCEALKIKENLREFVALICPDREGGSDRDGHEQAPQILGVFSGSFRTMFQQKLTALMLDSNTATLFNGDCFAEAYYEPSEIHAVFFYQAKTAADVLERFSDVRTLDEDTKSSIVSLCRMSGLSVDMGLLLPGVFLKKFLDVSCEHRILNHPQGGRVQQAGYSSGMQTFWGDLITKGYFNTRCADMDNFERKLTDLQELNTKYPNTYPLATMVYFTCPGRVVADLRQALESDYGVAGVLAATLDSLWVTNIPIRDICALIKLYEEQWNAGNPFRYDR